MTYLNEKDNKRFEGDGSLNEQGLSLFEFLKKYDPKKYDNPSNTADIAVFLKEEGCEMPKLLMIKRRNHPDIGMWALPGGFVEYREDIDAAAKRELEEETGVKAAGLIQVKTYGKFDRDPRTRVITTLYTTILPLENISFQAGDDAKDAAIFDIILENKVDNSHEISGGKFINMELTSKDMDLKLSAQIEEVYEECGLIVEKRRKLINSQGIACDHGMLIYDALQRILT